MTIAQNVKCDDAHTFCGNCMHLSIVCIYDLDSKKNKKGSPLCSQIVIQSPMDSSISRYFCSSIYMPIVNDNHIWQLCNNDGSSLDGYVPLSDRDGGAQ